jgi:hypothetical protein
MDLKRLVVQDLDGGDVTLAEIVVRPTLLIFLRHLA